MPLEHLSKDLFLKWSPIIPREEWGALPPAREDTPLDGVIQHVVFTYTEFEPCYSRDECMQTVQRMQKFHMDHGLADIPYRWVCSGVLFNFYNFSKVTNFFFV